MKILRMSDRITVQAKGITVTIAPMNHQVKTEVLGMIKVIGGKEVADVGGQTVKAIKHCVKKVEGLQDFGGADYEVTLDDNGNLTDDCVSEVIAAMSDVTLATAMANAAMGAVTVMPKGVEIKINGKSITKPEPKQGN
jgi:predicted extracellular nuclease